MSAKVSDEKTATDETISDFKRKSIDMGVAVNVKDFVLFAEKVQDFEAVANTFVDVIKAAKVTLTTLSKSSVAVRSGRRMRLRGRY